MTTNVILLVNLSSLISKIQQKECADFLEITHV
jgi:hypothetical protein